LLLFPILTTYQFLSPGSSSQLPALRKMVPVRPSGKRTVVCGFNTFGFGMILLSVG